MVRTSLGEMFPEIQAQTAFGVKQILVVALFTLYILRYEGLLAMRLRFWYVAED